MNSSTVPELKIDYSVKKKKEKKKKEKQKYFAFLLLHISLRRGRLDRNQQEDGADIVTIEEY